MRRLLISLSALALSAGVAHAGALVTPADPAVTAPAMQPRVHDWTGPWVGVAVGMGSTNYSVRGDASIDGTTLGTIRLPDFGGEGGLASLSAGYDFDLGNGFVVGAMLDVSTTRINNRANINILDDISGSYRLRPRTMMAAAGRVGFTTSDSTLVYGLLGYSQARFRANFSATDGFDTLSGSYRWRQSGPVIGGGIETRLTENATLRLEYRYHRLGNKTIFSGDIFGADVGLRTRTSIQTAQVGINWRF